MRKPSPRSISLNPSFPSFPTTVPFSLTSWTVTRAKTALSPLLLSQGREWKVPFLCTNAVCAKQGHVGKPGVERGSKEFLKAQGHTSAKALTPALGSVQEICRPGPRLSTFPVALQAGRGRGGRYYLLNISEAAAFAFKAEILLSKQSVASTWIDKEALSGLSQANQGGA